MSYVAYAHKTAVYVTLLVGVPLLMLSKFCIAQTFSFKRFEVEQGLAHNTVFSSHQDKTGFLWFGTMGGLSRFDGYQFKTYPLKGKSGAKYFDQTVNAIVNDKNGKLWVATSSGLFYLDNEKQSLVNVLDTITLLYHMVGDDDGNLWLLSAHSFYRYHTSTQKLYTFSAEAYFRPNCLSFTDSGELWFGTINGEMIRYNYTKNTFTSFDIFSHSRKGDRRVMAICGLANGFLLVGTSAQGVKIFDPQSGHYEDFLQKDQTDNTGIFVRDILHYKEDEYWLGTESGVYIISLKKRTIIPVKRNFSDPYSLSDNAVYTLTKDGQGGVWVGTYFGGIHYFSPRVSSIKRYFPGSGKNTISGRAVREIVQDSSGFIWMGTEDAGLNRFEKSSGNFLHLGPTRKLGGISHYNIHGLICVGNDLWVGTYHNGIDVVDTRTGKLKKHYDFGPGPGKILGGCAESFCLTRDKRLLIGTEMGLFFYDKVTKHFLSEPGFPKKMGVRHVMEDRQGGIWVATFGRGLFYRHSFGGVVENFSTIVVSGDSVSLLHVNHVMEDRQKRLWIATDNNGLFLLNRDQKDFTWFSEENLLPSNFVYKSLEDDKGDIWVTTGKGLVKFIEGTGRTVLYTKPDGLLNNQFNYASAFKDESGNLYFGSTKGLVTFHPEELFEEKNAPQLFITSLLKSGSDAPLSDTDKLSLEYNLSSFIISFAALDYSSSESILYSYKLEGLDEEWTKLETNRPVHFNNLPPGDYIFRVKARLPGRWQSVEKVLPIKVLPPFWSTRTAYIFYSLLFLTVIYFCFRYMKSREKLKFETARSIELERFNAEMLSKNKELEQLSSSLHQSHNENDRMVRIIAHDLRNPLAAITGFTDWIIKYGEKDSVGTKKIFPLLNKTATNTLLLVEQLLQLSFSPVDTRFDTIDLQLLLESCVDMMLPMAEKKGQTIILYPTTASIAGDQEKLWRVFSNLLGNAIKFGYPDTKVIVEMKMDDAAVIVLVKDEGIGIPNDMMTKIFEGVAEIKRNGTVGEPSFGLGLQMARHIINAHNGKIWIESKENVGSTILVSFPLVS